MQITLTQCLLDTNKMRVAVALVLLVAGVVLGVDTSKRRLPFRKFTLRPPPPLARATSRVDELRITQPLDHFDASNTATWEQRYFVNRDFYVSGGPVLLFIEGESEASPSWLQGGHMAEIAVQLGALAFSIEHRFYGQSRPTPDTTVGSLKYLSTPQALEDVANFVRTQKASDPALASAKWVVFGGSYAGNLAAWARLKYPDIIDGAVSSSGPVLAKADFFEYLEVVNNSLYLNSPQCVSDIQAAVAEVERLLQTTDGIDTLSNTFPLCAPLDASNTNDVAGIFSSISGVYSGVVQYNDPYYNDIGSICYQTTDPIFGATPYERISALALYGGSCLDNTFQSSVDYFGQTSWNSDASTVGWRQWIYQTCTEYGYYQTTNSAAQPFGNRVTLPYNVDLCSQAFGPEFDANSLDAGVSNTNSLYGGLSPQVTNVVFVHGSVDPWHALGILSDLSADAPAIYVPGQSHCADMYAKSETFDSPELLAAKSRIEELVRQWTQ